MWPADTFPFTALNVPLLVGALVLRPRTLVWFVSFMIVMVTIAGFLQPEHTTRTIAALVILFLACAFVLTISLRRSVLGIGGRRGESMLVDLRDRILAQGSIPKLPARQVQASQRSKGRTSTTGNGRSGLARQGVG